MIFWGCYLVIGINLNINFSFQREVKKLNTKIE